VESVGSSRRFVQEDQHSRKTTKGC
jgi:hypothetical protein